MSRVLTFLVPLLSISLAVAPAPAQSLEDEVLEVVDRLMMSIGDADSVTAASLFHPEARLVIIDSGTERRSVRVSPTQAFTSTVAQSAGRFEERVWDPQVLFDGDLALVWAPYDFHVDGQFSHCGVDAFHLTRGAEGWRFISIIYTRRTEGCERPPDR